MTPRVDRKLAAIFAADVAGFTRLVEADEAETIAALARHRTGLDSLLRKHAGRIANTAGDSVVAAFRSVADAVRCAVEAQEKMAASNESVPEDRRIRFRIGIHLGDVVVQGRDILGDGVNIAARLQSIAAPGTVVVSAAVHDLIHKQVPFQFFDMGLQQLKNLGRPLRAYQVIPQGGSGGGPPPVEARTDEGRPSIAVLPFENMSSDVEQDYFADGLVEDIITALSRNPMLVVIARHSSFTYKGRSANIRQVGRELGVRYALEGSVRKAGNKVRITGQLNDTENGSHVWADRFDGVAEDIFELQDRITERVVGALDVELRGAEIKRQRRRVTTDLSAYDNLVRGLGCMYEHTFESTAEALAHFRRTIDLDPSCAVAYGYAAVTLVLRRSVGWITDAQENARESIRLSTEAVGRGGDDAEALSLGALVQVCLGYELAASIELAEKSIALNSNSPFGWYALGLAKLALGSADEAANAIARGIRLNPRDPAGYAYLTSYALAQFLRKDYPEAIKYSDKALSARRTWVPALRVKAASLALSGRIDEAKAEILKAKAIEQTGSGSVMERMIQLRAADVGFYLHALRLAGLDD